MDQDPRLSNRSTTPYTPLGQTTAKPEPGARTPLVGQLNQHTVQQQATPNLGQMLGNLFQGLFNQPASSGWQPVPQNSVNTGGNSSAGEITFVDSMQALGASLEQVHLLAGKHPRAVDVYCRLFCGQNPVIQRAPDGQLACGPAINDINLDGVTHMADALAAIGLPALAQRTLAACAWVLDNKRDMAHLLMQGMDILDRQPAPLEAGTAMTLASLTDVLATAGLIDPATRMQWRTRLSAACPPLAMQLLPSPSADLPLSGGDLGKSVQILRQSFLDALAGRDHVQATVAYNKLVELNENQPQPYIAQALAECDAALAPMQSTEELGDREAALREAGFDFEVVTSMTGQCQIVAPQPFNLQAHGAAALAYLRARTAHESGMPLALLRAWTDLLQASATPQTLDRTELRLLHLKLAAANPRDAGAALQIWKNDLVKDLDTPSGGSPGAEEIALLVDGCKAQQSTGDTAVAIEILDFAKSLTSHESLKFDLPGKITLLQLDLLAMPGLNPKARVTVVAQIMAEPALAKRLNRVGLTNLLNGMLQVSSADDFNRLAHDFSVRFFEGQPAAGAVRAEAILHAIHTKQPVPLASLEKFRLNNPLPRVWIPLLATYVKTGLMNFPDRILPIFHPGMFTEDESDFQYFLALCDTIANQDIAQEGGQEELSCNKLLKIFADARSPDLRIAFAACAARIGVATSNHLHFTTPDQFEAFRAEMIARLRTFRPANKFQSNLLIFGCWASLMAHERKLGRKINLHTLHQEARLALHFAHEYGRPKYAGPNQPLSPSEISSVLQSIRNIDGQLTAWCDYDLLHQLIRPPTTRDYAAYSDDE